MNETERRLTAAEANTQNLSAAMAAERHLRDEWFAAAHAELAELRQQRLAITTQRTATAIALGLLPFLGCLVCLILLGVMIVRKVIA